MMRAPTVLAFLAAALVPLGCSSAGPAPTKDAPASDLPKEAVLRLKGEVGDQFTLTTTLETEAELPGSDGKIEKGTMTLSTTEQHNCEAVAEGKQTWRAKTIDVTSSGTGPLKAEAERAKNEQMGKSKVLTKDERNRVLGSSADETMALTFPESAVKPGDTWTSDTTLAGASVQITFKLERFEKVGEKTAAVLSANVTGGDKVKSTDPVMIYVDVATGWPIRGSAGFAINPMPGVTSVLKVRMEAK